MVNKIPAIEDMDVAGANRNRAECFKIAQHVTCKQQPHTETEFNHFMNEYVRQLVGPEVYDTYATYEGDVADVGKVFRIIRKYTLGA